MTAKTIRSGIERLIDANLNRSKEGLRVCEDIFRFIKNNKRTTRALKDLRHEITCAVGTKKIAQYINDRCIERDVGKTSNLSELERTDIGDVLFANLQRSKESIRVLEEMFKISCPKTSKEFKEIRYKLYAIEKRIFKKI